MEGRVIEGNSSCSDDVERYEERMGSFAETSRVYDVYDDEVLRGVEHPEGW